MGHRLAISDKRIVGAPGGKFDTFGIIGSSFPKAGTVGPPRRLVGHQHMAAARAREICSLDRTEPQAPDANSLLTAAIDHIRVLSRVPDS
jgi:hypothetical protein